MTENTTNAGEWPKSFHWHADPSDKITFRFKGDIAVCNRQIRWTLGVIAMPPYDKLWLPIVNDIEITAAAAQLRTDNAALTQSLAESHEREKFERGWRAVAEAEVVELKRLLAEHSPWNPGVGIQGKGPGGCGCCCCGTCRHHHDDCVCAHNEIEAALANQQTN